MKQTIPAMMPGENTVPVFGLEGTAGTELEGTAGTEPEGTAGTELEGTAGTELESTEGTELEGTAGTEVPGLMIAGNVWLKAVSTLESPRMVVMTTLELAACGPGLVKE